ncbi:hypothetical protein [Lactiplantibacillus pentosus]|uniref:hypothetical protein n=1 Tax=Lactiplantibacillus pentosus TaxID=1589 RepID=UPI001C1FA665|nr:hypothetical protein [Lactiplantibacillus pentosus]MBU7503420.1 hypothetical protein [Lactiplantibacillus pentosus]MCG0633054.1 prophage P2a protein 33 [Lactiplantibacillus plantarum]MDY1544148.1 hypothetical protein [Lactiplantibacillus pentosus]
MSEQTYIFEKKPVRVSAYQTKKPVDIQTLEGTMHADINDWIVTGINGEKYPVKPDIFNRSYKKVLD